MNKTSESTLAPVVLFVYNRPWHTEQTLNALKSNEFAEQTLLYIFCDGAKKDSTSENSENIRKVHSVVRSGNWCRKTIVIETDENKGLAASVISGVTEVINRHGKVIVLEDDVVPGRFFLRFMNEALRFYAEDERIFSVGGVNYAFKIPKHYPHDVFIVQRTVTWGWGTWSDRWQKADWSIQNFDPLFNNKKEIKKFTRGGNDLLHLLRLKIEGKIDSWAIIWDYYHYKYEKFCIRPVFTLVQNIGLDGTGINCGVLQAENFFAKPYSRNFYDLQMVKNIQPDKKLESNFKKFLQPQKSILHTFLKLVKKLNKRILKIKTGLLSISG